MKLFKLLSLLLLMTVMAVGCSKDIETLTGQIVGKVTCAETGEPIRAASVVLTPSGKAITTGDNGIFELNDVETGQYELQVKKTGYLTSTRQISVVSGDIAKGDLSISPINKTSKIKLNTNELNFGKTHTSLTFEINNIGNTGIVDWTITDVDANWITVSPLVGSTDMGKSTAVKVDLDRTKLVNKVNRTNIIINADGESLSLSISADLSDEGGNTDPDPTPDPDDVKITSCDNRIEVKFVSCERSGANLKFNYTMTNKGADIRFFSMGNGENPIYDDLGNGYEFDSITFGKEISYFSIQNVPFPEGVTVKCSLVIKDVNTEAKLLQIVSINCEAKSPNNFMNDKITFKKAPIK